MNALINSEHFDDMNPNHTGLLNATLHSPSAHNAQPWQIRPVDDIYELHYNQSSNLPEDHDNKDAYLTMGAFVETMALTAPNYNLTTTITPQLTRNGEDLFIARVALDNLDPGAHVDPLSAWVDQRVTNRNSYQKDLLPHELEEALKQLGNVLIEPKMLKDVVMKASMEAWGNSRYVHDLQKWMRKDNDAEDGMTPAPFNLGKFSLAALDFAYRQKGFSSKLMRYAYASGDVGAFTAASEAAVISVPDKTPTSLFDAGRRLLRSWVTITAAGYSYQPFSVAVDEKSSAIKVAEIAGVENAVALYRVGKAVKPPRGNSNRKPLKKVLV